MKKHFIFTILVLSFVLSGCGKDVEQGTQNIEQGTLQEGGQAQNIEQSVDDVVQTGNDSIKVFDIEAGDNLVSPVTIKGEGIAFENNLIVELRNSKHETLVKEFTTIKSTEVGKSGPFEITLNFEFNNTKEGYLAVYEQSAKDGSELNLVEIPVRFNDDTEITDNSKQTTGNWQTYRNEEYGFEFKYPVDEEVVKVNNKFYIGGLKGQFVEVFDKEEAQSLKEAIEKEFLTEYPKEDCFVEDEKVSGDIINVSAISFPENKGDGPWWVNNEKCPMGYSQTNGVRYFQADKRYFDKFVFFNIGQYAIPISCDDAGNNCTDTLWQNTFKFTN